MAIDHILIWGRKSGKEMAYSSATVRYTNQFRVSVPNNGVRLKRAGRGAAP